MNKKAVFVLLLATLLATVFATNILNYYSKVVISSPQPSIKQISTRELGAYVLAYCLSTSDGNPPGINSGNEEVVITVRQLNTDMVSIYNSHSTTLSRNATYKFGCVEAGNRIRYLGNALYWRPYSDQLTFVSGIAPTLTDFNFISVSRNLEIENVDTPIAMEDYYKYFHDPQGIFWSPEGNKFVTLGFDTQLINGGGPNIWSYDIKTNEILNLTKLPSLGNYLVNAAWSSDGNNVAVGYGHPYSGIAIVEYANPNNYIEITSRVVKELKDWPYPLGKLTSSIFSNQTSEFNYYITRTSQPIWLNNNGMVLFVGANQDQKATFFTVNSDGTDLKELFPDLEGIVALPKLSPNGKELAFIRYPDWKKRTYVEIDILDLQTMKIKFLLSLQAPKSGDELLISGMDWSPDGKYLAFSSNHEGESDIFLITSDGTSWTNITKESAGNAVSPSFMP